MLKTVFFEVLWQWLGSGETAVSKNKEGKMMQQQKMAVILEDNDLRSRSMAFILRKLGFLVRVFLDFSLTMEFLFRQKPEEIQLLVLASENPLLNQKEIITCFRRAQPNCRIILVVRALVRKEQQESLAKSLSVAYEDEKKKQGFLIGCDAFLTKPVSLKKMQEALEMK